MALGGLQQSLSRKGSVQKYSVFKQATQDIDTNGKVP